MAPEKLVFTDGRFRVRKFLMKNAAGSRTTWKYGGRKKAYFCHFDQKLRSRF